MIYFKNGDDTWTVGARGVFFPDGTSITKDTPGSKNGYTWHDTPPQQFLNWINSLSGEELAKAIRNLPKGIPGLPDLPAQAEGPN